jgi:molybdopterin converting factor small subunit
MALKMILTSLDGLEAPIAALYKERNGGFQLDVEDAKSQADVDAVRTALEKLKEQLAAWGDKNPAEVLPLLEKIPEMEIAIAAGKGKWDDKQVEAIAAQRLAAQKAVSDAALNKITEELKAERQLTSDYKTKDQRRTIFDEVRKLAAESKASPESYQSEYSGLMLLAKEMFTVNEAGQVVVREGAPNPEVMVPGIHAKDVFGSLQKSHGYFWPPSQGGGAGGSRGNTDASSNPFKDNNMTKRAEFVAENRNTPEGLARIAAAVKAAGLNNEFEPYVKK